MRHNRRAESAGAESHAATRVSDDEQERSLALVLTPQGHLRLIKERGAPALQHEVAERLSAAFARGAGHGLLALGAREIGTLLPSVFAWWREFGARYITAVCATAADDDVVVAPLDAQVVETLMADAPPMRGAEYLTAQALA